MSSRKGIRGFHKGNRFQHIPLQRIRPIDQREGGEDCRLREAPVPRRKDLLRNRQAQLRVHGLAR